MAIRPFLLVVLFLARQLNAGDLSSETNGAPGHVTRAQIRQAVARSLALLETASVGSADNRKCFTCHSQALPVIAVVEAERQGFRIDAENLGRQVEHTHSHLRRGLHRYADGRGQGGGVDTAGYALWTLDVGGRWQDGVTTAVTDWLLRKQEPEGLWKTSSKRPPSEASHFTATYLALRGLNLFGSNDTEIEKATQSAASWASDKSPKDTEDQVFRLLTIAYNGAHHRAALEDAVRRLTDEQREDGGWAQTGEMESDAYATGTVLYALRQVASSKMDGKMLQRAIQYLINSQLDDGSWHVKSRSDPFQTYFETGFPHEADQFISTSATSWATLALLDQLARSRSSVSRGESR